MRLGVKFILKQLDYFNMLYLNRILLLMHDVLMLLPLRISLIYLLVPERYINITHDPLQLEVTSLNIQGLISWLTLFLHQG